jgi:hypothetical protein
MRTDELAPRVSLFEPEAAQSKNWFVINPAFWAILAAFVAGAIAASVFQSLQTGNGFRTWWRLGCVAVFWFVMAIVGVVRGLNKSRP